MERHAHPFLDIAVIEDIRERLANGDALIVLSRDLDHIYWANGPGADLFGFDSFDKAIGEDPSLPVTARRQISGLRGFPDLPHEIPVLVRMGSLQGSRTIAFRALTIRLPDDEAAILLAVPAEALGRADHAALVNGLAGDGRHVALLDHRGQVLEATPAFSQLELTQETLFNLCEEVNLEEDRLVKRMVTSAQGPVPMGIAQLRDDPALSLLLVLDPELEDDEIAFPSEDSAAAGPKETVQEKRPFVPRPGSIAELVSRAWPGKDRETASNVALPSGNDPTNEVSAQTVQSADNEPTDPTGETSFEPKDDDVISGDESTGPVAGIKAQTESGLNDCEDDFVPALGPDAPPRRFVWRTDDESRFTDLSNDFAEIVGPEKADIIGRPFDEVMTAFDLDPQGEINGLLSRRDTWSGRSVLWPVQNSRKRIPVDLAALPIYNRDREFEGFRGFGVLRPADAVDMPDDHATEMAITPPAILPDDNVSAVNDSEGNQSHDQDAETHVQSLLEDSDPFQGETPALSIDRNRQKRRFSDKVVSLAAHRDIPLDRDLSPSETAAFRKIGEQLKENEDDDHLHMEITAEPAESGVDDYTLVTDAKDRQDDAGSGVVRSAFAGAGIAGAMFSSGRHESQPPEENSSPKDDLNADLVIPHDPEHGDSAQSSDPEETEEKPEPAAPVFPSINAYQLMPGRQNTDTDREPGQTDISEPVPDEMIPAPSMAMQEGSEWHDGDEKEPDTQEPDQAVLGDENGQAANQPDTVTPDHDYENEEPGYSSMPLSMAASEMDTDAVMAPGIDEDEHEAKPLAARLSAGDVSPSFLARLPVPVLVIRGDHLAYANSAFLSQSGYSSVAELEDAGGMDMIISESGPEGSVLMRADGSTERMRTHMQRIGWQGGNALMFAFMENLPIEQDAAGPERENTSSSKVNAFVSSGTTDELKETVRQLNTILDTATDGIVLIDNDGSVRALNKSAQALFAMESDEISGRPFSELFAVESQRSANEYLASLSGNGVASVLNDGREMIGRDAKGRFIPLFMTIGKLPDDGGYCAVLRDITNWKRAEESLTEARRDAESASLQKTDFLARVSHEIRTPLNAIIGFSELMIGERFGPIDNDRYKDYLRDINRSGSHVLDLVNDLLDISKIESGQQEFLHEAVALNDLLAEAVAIMQPQANRERVIIRSSFGSGLPDIVADTRSVRQIALNLLSNAVRFTQPGGRVIVSTAQQPSGEVTLHIRDTGIGMTESDIEHAMKPFKQINTLRRDSRGGTGLGLPLTKTLVEANKGRFALTSKPGEGTIAEVIFPFTRVLTD